MSILYDFCHLSAPAGTLSNMPGTDKKIMVLTKRLAKLFGLETGYRDTEGKWQEATVDSLVTVLRGLGADLPPEMKRVSALEHGLETRVREIGERLAEPVLLAWDGWVEPLALRLREPSDTAFGVGRTRDKVRLTLTLEDGTCSDVEIDAAWCQVSAATGGISSLTGFDGLDGLASRACVVPPHIWTGRTAIGVGSRTGRRQSARLPFGYHRLVIESAGTIEEVLVISAPKKCPSIHNALPAGAWGVFAPLYALRSERDWGAGDLTELEQVLQKVGATGGSVVATLPLLATYLDVPFESAPYRPVSRLLWNEFYLAPERVQGFGECETALRLYESTGLQNRLSALREGRYVDYRETMALKREVLEELAAAFFASGRASSDPSYRRFLEVQQEATQYADFRERVEVQGGDWRAWTPGRSTLGGERPGEKVGRARAERISPRYYHLFCQWRMEEAMATLADAEASAGLFLDLPVGTHPGGYDTWRWGDLFASELSTGAPPDSFFSGGQDWAFPPLHPDVARRSGHEYFAACVRHHMRHASALRVDHMMGLHRLYVIPTGEPATNGVYLRYPAEELYAVLTLESGRSGTVVAGEDLGTVPKGVRATMRRRGVVRTWVLQLSLRPRAATPVTDIPSSSVSSLNTHDMIPWAGFLQGRDIEERLDTGQISPDQAAREAEERAVLRARLAAFLIPSDNPAHSKGTSSVDGSNHCEQASAETLLRGALVYMYRHSDGPVMLNLEDLLLETEPQNLPGTGAERPNWRRKVAVEMEQVLRSIARAASWLTD